MFLSKIKKIKKKAEKLTHFISSLMVLITALDKYESGNSTYIYFAIAGIVFLLVAIYHSKIVNNFTWVDNIFIFLEGSISLLIAFDYFQIGKKALPFAYLFAGIMQFIVGFFKIKKILSSNKIENENAS
jgi:hypothetical protein